MYSRDRLCCTDYDWLQKQHHKWHDMAIKGGKLTSMSGTVMSIVTLPRDTSSMSNDISFTS